MLKKEKAKQNRTLEITNNEINKFSKGFLTLNKKVSLSNIFNKVINQDFFDAIKYLPEKFVDLLIVDPPYNMNKKFNSTKFSKLKFDDYTNWLEKLIINLKKTLKENASIYFCGDWYSSTSIFLVLNKHFNVRNRITWEREKGRGSKTNWKNSSEDIWFCTVSDDYYFNIENVKLKRKVLAPYKVNGSPKDWELNSNGNFRDTFPSNIWMDITVPFWSMRENTEHPTQKPEKLIAKLILASSKEGDIVFDPFLGSGTTAVVAKKLNRNFLGIEIDKKYSAITLKRLALAESNKEIQGFYKNIFWERNSLKFQY